MGPIFRRDLVAAYRVLDNSALAAGKYDQSPGDQTASASPCGSAALVAMIGVNNFGKNAADVGVAARRRPGACETR
jgi:hypothetical protein